ncbi:MAG: sugar phosphate isomerase/epimerase [Clostridiales bacterium]|nr:sugar phosphate isomerase/epimerase [Clostridiales bacterium]
MDGKDIFNRLGYAATLGEKNIFTVIDFAKERGYRAIEINLNVPAFFPEKYNLEDRQKIREKIEEEGIILSFHAPEDIPLYHLHENVRKAGLERFKECIDFAKDIGGKKITIHPGESVCFTQTDKKIYLIDVYAKEYKKIFRESLIELRDHAKDEVEVCIENVGNFNQLIKDVLEELIPQGGLYLTWDIGHSYGKQEDIDFFKKNREYIRNCHIHDHNGKQDHQVIGDGNIDFIEYFQILKDMDTSFIIEVRPIEKALLSREKLRKLLL